VKKGLLRCSGSAGIRAVTFEAGGAVYAINGTAKADHPGVDPIWKKDPEIPGARVDIRGVLRRGLDLC
jgi:hypothetical protein